MDRPNAPTSLHLLEEESAWPKSWRNQRSTTNNQQARTTKEVNDMAFERRKPSLETRHNMLLSRHEREHYPFDQLRNKMSKEGRPHDKVSWSVSFVVKHWEDGRILQRYRKVGRAGISKKWSSPPPTQWHDKTTASRVRKQHHRILLQQRSNGALVGQQGRCIEQKVARGRRTLLGCDFQIMSYNRLEWKSRLLTKLALRAAQISNMEYTRVVRCNQILVSGCLLFLEY